MAKRSFITEDDDPETEIEENPEEEEETSEDEEEEEEQQKRGKRIIIRLVSGERRGFQLQSQFVNTSSSCSGSSNNGSGLSYLGCQADECGRDLSDAKVYHRRHKVCERHAKASVVLVKGVRQRFCQQCSRFHEISQFDNIKRSCRSRLAGHNERRRKIQADQQEQDVRRSPDHKTNSRTSKATVHPHYGEMSLKKNTNAEILRIK